MPQVAVASLADLQERQSVKFRFRRDGIKRDGFAALVQGQVVVYENLCRHIPISIDYGDNRFFTPDGQHIVCQTHGAMYDPLTGLCLRGPCEGATLFKIPFELRNDSVWIETETDPE